MAVHKDGNAVYNTISDCAEAECDNLREIRSRLDALYWEMHKELAETSYPSRHEQREAMDRLGRLALGLTALDEAHSAINRARCW